MQNEGKPWSHILAFRFEFLVLFLWALIPCHRLCFGDFESQFLCSVAWIDVSRSWSYDPSPDSWDAVIGSLVLIHSVIITKGGKKLLQNVSDITKHGNYYKVWQKVSTKCYGYYKVWQLQPSVTQNYCKVDMQNKVRESIAKCGDYFNVKHNINSFNLNFCNFCIKNGIGN